MKWIEAKNRPEYDSMCWVVNRKYGCEVVRAIFNKIDDVFVMYDPNYIHTLCLDITHYIIEPELPRMEE